MQSFFELNLQHKEKLRHFHIQDISQRYQDTSEEFLDNSLHFQDPKSVVHPDSKLIKQWFIDLKDKELKDFMRPKKQLDLDQFIFKS